MFMVNMMTCVFSMGGFGHPVFLKPHFGHPVMKDPGQKARGLIGFLYNRKMLSYNGGPMVNNLFMT